MNPFFYSLLFFVALSFNISAQQTKLFSGNITLSAPWNQAGKASYSYYEKDGKQIKDGPYTFTFEKNGFIQSITGAYRNGQPEGSFIYTIQLTDFASSLTGELLAGTITMKTSFTKGLPDGSWEYHASFKTRKTAAGSTYSNPSDELVKMTCLNGVIIGNFSTDILEGTTGIRRKLTATLDSTGFLTGQMISYYNNESVINPFRNVEADKKKLAAYQRQEAEKSDSLKLWASVPNLDDFMYYCNYGICVNELVKRFFNNEYFHYTDFAFPCYDKETNEPNIQGFKVITYYKPKK